MGATQSELSSWRVTVMDYMIPGFWGDLNLNYSYKLLRLNFQLVLRHETTSSNGPPLDSELTRVVATSDETFNSMVNTWWTRLDNARFRTSWKCHLYEQRLPDSAADNIWTTYRLQPGYPDVHWVWPSIYSVNPINKFDFSTTRLCLLHWIDIR